MKNQTAKKGRRPDLEIVYAQQTKGGNIYTRVGAIWLPNAEQKAGSFKLDLIPYQGSGDLLIMPPREKADKADTSETSAD